MPVKSLKTIKNLKGKRVLVRVDFNVPIKKGKVLDKSRLFASLPTIKYLLDKKAIVILVTHIGRPEGKIVSALKVDPVIKELSKILKKKVKKLEIPKSFTSGQAQNLIAVKNKLKLVKSIDKLKPGQISMMENIRFSPDEEKNTGSLGQELASLVDIFVLDGFAISHRGSASVVGVAKFVPSYAGLLLEKEIVGLDRVIKKPKNPFVIILGGAKTETKIPIIKNLLPKADNILIGGCLVNTYLKAKGYKVGDSLLDVKFEKDALNYCSKKKVIKPIDVVVGSRDGKKYRVVSLDKKTVCEKGEAIFDIGPETIRLYSCYIKKAQTLVWNGAMGYFEQKPYDTGTLSIARLLGSRSKGKAFGVVGGGETLQAVDMVGMIEDVDLISTGGGAMLEYLSGKELPGIKALDH